MYALYIIFETHSLALSSSGEMIGPRTDTIVQILRSKLFDYCSGIFFGLECLLMANEYSFAIQEWYLVLEGFNRS
jgi:hypothetical protein